MKNKMLAIGGLSVVLLFSACSSSEGNTIGDDLVSRKIEKTIDVQVVEVNDQYSIEVPASMVPTTSLNRDASLQYNNRFEEEAVIVIDESKEDFVEIFKNIGEYDDAKSIIENYATVQSVFHKEGMKLISETDIEFFSINGMKGARKNVDADVYGIPEPISYYLGFAEGEESLYMIMAWTLRSRKDDFTKEASKMIGSLKEMK